MFVIINYNITVVRVWNVVVYCTWLVSSLVVSSDWLLSSTHEYSTKDM